MLTEMLEVCQPFWSWTNKYINLHDIPTLKNYSYGIPGKERFQNGNISNDKQQGSRNMTNLLTKSNHPYSGSMLDMNIFISATSLC